MSETEISKTSERLELARGRIGKIPDEHTVPEPFEDYFRSTASFLLLALDGKGRTSNAELYADILPDHYDLSYGNPAYASEKLGNNMGPLLSAVYTELRGIIPCVFEDDTQGVAVLLELFLELYGMFEEEIPSVSCVKEAFVSYCTDYMEDFIFQRIGDTVDPSHDFVNKIIMHSDLNDLSYLNRFGEYISENTRQTAAFMNSLPQEKIDLMAKTFTEGYRMGFISGRKDIRKKKTVGIRFEMGFERMVRAAVCNFREMGLEATFCRAAYRLVDKRQNLKIGWFGADPNPAFNYDHRNDISLLLNEQFVSEKLRATRNAYEEMKVPAAQYGGPACIDTFGEKLFEPISREGTCSLTPQQNKLYVNLNNQLGQITNRYIKGEERSFTIIAFPVPEIGKHFPDIFEDTVRVNTLDSKKYEVIQQNLIDTLDAGDRVHILGRGKNRTDLLVQLHPVDDPKRETKFENCVADVNIPVGEVFTSPVLKGTNGLLHVTYVFLNGLAYKDLFIRLTDGKITDYGCSNFNSEHENRGYIEENILFHHPTLPIGEFAIGTNTTAYVMARKYGIEAAMPILIAEKTGPHFAMGDTCYSYEEDTPVYNPDGKEIIARDNEITRNRKSHPEEAYFGCHTDITIPYDELASITSVHEDGSEVFIIRDGRFVLPGTEELNGPLDEISL